MFKTSTSAYKLSKSNILSIVTSTLLLTTGCSNSDNDPSQSADAPVAVTANDSSEPVGNLINLDTYQDIIKTVLPVVRADYLSDIHQKFLTGSEYWGERGDYPSGVAIKIACPNGGEVVRYELHTSSSGSSESILSLNFQLCDLGFATFDGSALLNQTISRSNAGTREWFEYSFSSFELQESNVQQRLDGDVSFNSAYVGGHSSFSIEASALDYSVLSSNSLVEATDINYEFNYGNVGLSVTDLEDFVQEAGSGTVRIESASDLQTLK